MKTPYLTTFNFYLWGYTKEEVYKTKPRHWKTWRQEFKRLSTRDVDNKIPYDIWQMVAHFISGRLRKLVEVISAYCAL